MVIWSEPAKADLRSIHDFIDHDSHHYAKKVTQDIREKTDVLNELPKVGKKVPGKIVENVRAILPLPIGLFIEIRTNLSSFASGRDYKQQDLKAEDVGK
ncbi:type II toxin-antitoxin system RelE/ParE family toxin [endosymbiont of Lamellibrachia barhami]|uniref:type II toxin-antitoxin system RelE/ParE family toxin n=1 Tax=endosymbiont of Lamellibrachia barhami TaxID=205975 RepID=UPI0015A8445A